MCGAKAVGFADAPAKGVVGVAGLLKNWTAGINAPGAQAADQLVVGVPGELK